MTTGVHTTSVPRIATTASMPFALPPPLLRANGFELSGNAYGARTDSTDATAMAEPKLAASMPSAGTTWPGAPARTVTATTTAI